MNRKIQSERLEKTLTAIDRVNAEDPETVSVNGRPVPSRLRYGHRMSHWLGILEPVASETLQLAARAQHIRRWDIPRDSYPRTRAGYLAWRRRLGAYHGEVLAPIMASHGYSAEDVSRAASLLRKEGLKRDPETQTLEDCTCLVFLEDHLEEFSHLHSEEKLVEIINKTWKKMSEKGHTEALKLRLKPEMQKVVAKALAV